MEQAVAFWSGGKDSALALDRVRRGGEFEIAALITTISEEYKRVSMHGVREELVEAQARAAGFPLDKMYVGPDSSNATYVAALRLTLDAWRKRGVKRAVFGDIFLADLRQWREKLLAEIGMTGLFPLWQADTRALAGEFVARGFRALTCCVNDAWLSESDVGHALDAGFFAGLGPGIDPCGENGEYHSFVHDGPVFRHPVSYRLGEKIYRPLELPKPHDDGGPAIPLPASSGPGKTKGFWFADILPG